MFMGIQIPKESLKYLNYGTKTLRELSKRTFNDHRNVTYLPYPKW